MMMIVDITPDWVMHLFESVNLFVDFSKFMLPVDVIHRARQRLEVDKGRL